MNGCTSSSVKYSKPSINQLFIQRISNYFHKSHYEKLKGTNSAQNASERNQDGCHGVRSTGKTLFLDVNFLMPMAIEDFLPERSQENVKLDNNCIDKESVGKCRPGVVLDESHQEAKTNQHHYIYILIHRVVSSVDGRVVVHMRTDEYSVQYDDNDFNHKQ
jgi:hypothetical protein